MELTKLQRLGISTLLLNYRYHGNNWFHDGTITFENNINGNFTILRVKTIKGTQKMVLSFTLDINENIDCGITYGCSYDYDLDVFRITTNEKIGGDC